MTGVFTMDDVLPEHSDDAGFKIMDIANAIQVWSCLKDGPTTVADAMATFNCDAAVVVEAVREHSWMFLAGNPDAPVSTHFIEHDGE